MKFLVVDDERDVEMLFRQKFRKAIRSGAKEFFTKPIDFESLKTELHQMIEQSD